ncbi:MAG: aconitate hydratase, partial [Rhodospirillales bacterium]
RKPNAFKDNYESIFEGTGLWQKLEAPSGPLFPWDDSSTYIKEPPFFQNLYSKSYQSLTDSFEGARVLCAFSDSLTTDHIIPSGEITRDSSAGQYLLATGVTENKFNAMTMRRGNHDVMIRGTFANPRIKNLLVPDIN